MTEGSNSLRLVVLKDRKRGLIQIGDQVVALIDHGSVQDDFLDLFLKNENATAVLVVRRRLVLRRAGLVLRLRACGGLACLRLVLSRRRRGRGRTFLAGAYAA